MNKEITTLEELETAIYEILNDPAKASMEDLEKFKMNLQPISIHIEDKDHPSAISAEMLYTFTSYQDLIYRAVKIAKYGYTSKHLSDEDKNGFTLYVTFRQGSLFSDIDLQSIMESAVEKMNGWQLFGGFTFAVLVWGIVKCFGFYSNNKRITKQDFNRSQERLAEIQANKDIAEAQIKSIGDIAKLAEGITIASSNALETLAKVNGSISINGKQYQRGELMEMAKVNRDDFYGNESEEIDSEPEIKQKFISGNFLTSRIDLKVNSSGKTIDKRCINLINVDTGETLKGIEISGKNMTAEQRDMILNAVDGKPLELKMTIAYRDPETIDSIYILECNGKSFEQPELF